MTSTPIDATAAAEYFLAGARDGSLSHVCISPGSRSTPLAVAAERTDGLTTSIHLDERVAAFTALGRAAITGRPVGLICTSGTAGANYLPAISEASMSHVPLVVMTADRPPEHQSWGVGQTFDQTGLFHRQVRAEFTMPVGSSGGRDFSHRAGWRAAVTASEDAGPVHVNWPFRLPLEPTSGPQQIPPVFDAPANGPEQGVRAGELDRLVSLLKDASHPVIVAGPQSTGAHQTPETTAGRAKKLCESAAESGVPILADALSGLRGPDRRALVPRPSLVTVRDEHGSLSADLIIHVGQTPTAKALRLWWESTSAVHVLIDPHGEWHDPSHLANHRFVSDPIELLAHAFEAVDFDQDHLATWLAAGEAADRICLETMGLWPASHEARIAAALGDHVQPNDVLVASSSMPVRDVDTYVSTQRPVCVHANRGINGIDGVVSTAAGIASTLTSGHCFVLIGDVALHHDVGGVLDAARNQVRLTIVVVNNDGGGIFSHLPARASLDEPTFDRLFQTAHGANFDFLGGYPGVGYHRATDVAEVLDESRSRTEPVQVIEILTDSSGRAQQHADLINKVRS